MPKVQNSDEHASKPRPQRTGRVSTRRKSSAQSSKRRVSPDSVDEKGSDVDGSSRMPKRESKRARTANASEPDVDTDGQHVPASAAEQSPDAVGSSVKEIKHADTKKSGKRKLPTIKKIKPPAQTEVSASTTQTGTVNATTQPSKTNEATSPILPLPRKPPPTSADVDLRNPTLYAELFKGTGGGTPRSGLNRREKELEKRKELERMRDEDRARRAAVCKNTFNHQGQAEKIQSFELGLKRAMSSALYPNFLAASFRDDFERRQRRERRKGEEREEGEMP